MTGETENTEAETETQEVEATEPENISHYFDDDAEVPEESTEGAEASEKGDTEDTGETGETDDDKAAETKAESESETGDETGESDSETPSEEDASVPRRALIDERRKRQEAQEELERLRQQYGATEEDAPDPTDDPQAYEQYLRQKWEKEQWEKTANRSRERMMESKPDYEEKEKHFLTLAQQDPDLVKQMNEDPDPAAFAYNKAKESLDAQEQAIEKRVLERLKKEGKLKDDDSEKGKKSTEAASKVSDLTSATAAGKNSEDDVTESENPEDVFGDELAY